MAAKKKAAGKTPKRKAKPTKDETVEVDNSMSLLLGNMPPSRDLIYHMDTIAGLIDKARTAAAKVTEAKKRAKEAGVDVVAIMDVMKEERIDALELATRLRQKAALYRERGLPVQLALYEPKHGSIEAQASAEGWSDGINGRSPNMERWPEKTPGSAEYLRRWNDSQKEILMKNADAKEE